MALNLEKARELSRMYKLPKGICTCRHSGDGLGSDHATIYAPGHGACLVKGCDCKQFTWAGRTLAFQHQLDKYASDDS